MSDAATRGVVSVRVKLKPDSGGCAYRFRTVDIVINRVVSFPHVRYMSCGFRQDVRYCYRAESCPSLILSCPVTMSTPAGPSPTDMQHHAPSNSKPHRVLACVLCQQRKIRCDRTFPCANCKKQNARCVPATQTRPRRKRFPERELLDRLRRYEALLRENRVKFEPLHGQEFQDGEGIGDVDNGTGDDSGGESEKLGLRSPSGSLKSENVTEAR